MRNGKGGFIRRIDIPRNVTKVIPMLKIRATDDGILACCSPAVYGYATHWDGKRTRPCTAVMGQCKFCKDPNFSTRDKGVILVATTAGQLHGFLELTPLAFDDLVRLSKTMQGLRGMLLRVRRQHQSMKGRLMVEYTGQYSGPVELPADQDPEPTLRRMFGLPDVH